MDCLEGLGADVRVQSAIAMPKVCEPFIQRRAQRHLQKGRIVIFVAGTGNPFFSTDTTAALRASEIKADVIFKATKVDGIYDKDPQAHSDAKRYERLTFDEALHQDLKVMDTAAFALCRENKVPILVFAMAQEGALLKAARGEQIGTLVHG
jgi:uridylate kinase